MSIRAWHSCKLRSQASDSILRWQELPEGLEWSSVVGFFFFKMRPALTYSYPESLGPSPQLQARK